MPASRRRTALALAVLPLLAVAACDRRDGSGAGTSASAEAAGDASASGPVKLGYFGDLSGQTAAFGQSTLRGVRLAVEELNAAGGIAGRQVELVVEDDQGRPEQAATVVTKLTAQDRVFAIVGENASTNTLAAAPVAQRARVPLVSPSSTNLKVTQVGDHIFRVCFIDSFQGEVMGTFAARSLGARTAALLVDTNADYSRGLADFFERSFAAQGGRIVERQSYQQSDRDFASQLTTIRAAAPDVLFVPGYYTQVGVIARQAKQLGLGAVLLGGDGWDAPQLFELGGAALDGAFFSNHFSADDPAPSIRRFVDGYAARNEGQVPDSLAMLGYESVGLIADAARRAGTVASPALRDALAATRDYAGVSGNLALDADRNPVKPAVVLELRGGKYVFRERVAPASTASAAVAPSAPTAPAAPTPPAP